MRSPQQAADAVKLIDQFLEEDLKNKDSVGAILICISSTNGEKTWSKENKMLCRLLLKTIFAPWFILC